MPELSTQQSGQQITQQPTEQSVQNSGQEPPLNEGKVPQYADDNARLQLAVLALSVGAISVCGIIYQLIVGTVSTYLLGNSTFQFSTTIGLFMSAYGLGSFASTRVSRNLLDWFVLTEILIGLLGGFSGLLLFLFYAAPGNIFTIARIVLILSLGCLVGLEVPILIRIVEDLRKNLRMTVGQIMGFDYLGALLGGVGFPLVFLPMWGLIGSSFLVGVFNTLVAVGVLVVFKKHLRWRRALWAGTIAISLALGAAFFAANPLERYVERELYDDPMVYLEQTPYQKVVLTKYRDDIRLFLDGSLQFSSSDEYRYHETLVHPAASRLEKLERVLVLGGGDGLALRELARHQEARRQENAPIGQVTLVDLDPSVVRLARERPELVELNEDAFSRLPVDILNEDAFNFADEYAREGRAPYDLIIVDLPDPHHESLAKLYSVSFYRNLWRILAEDGLMVAQVGSPFFANRSFWSAAHSIEVAGFVTRPYHVNVPSFGEWGFVLAGGHEVPEAPRRAIAGRYFDSEFEAHLFHFPPDLRQRFDIAPNTLMHPVIVEYFSKDWKSWN